MKCSACGSTALVEGSVMDTGSGGGLGFQPADVSTLKKMFGMAIRRIVSYGCIHCRNLQLTVEFNERDIQKYQEFEGQQPGVLERINSGEERETS
jgi:predicted nucleic-acid-binding Zn-ribbon protein